MYKTDSLVLFCDHLSTGPFSAGTHCCTCASWIRSAPMGAVTVTDPFAQRSPLKAGYPEPPLVAWSHPSPNLLPPTWAEGRGKWAHNIEPLTVDAQGAAPSCCRSCGRNAGWAGSALKQGCGASGVKSLPLTAPGAPGPLGGIYGPGHTQHGEQGSRCDPEFLGLSWPPSSLRAPGLC